MPEQTEQGQTRLDDLWKTASDLFLWLGFQLSDDNDCHRFVSGPVQHIVDLLSAERGQGRREGIEEAASIVDWHEWLPHFSGDNLKDCLVDCAAKIRALLLPPEEAK